MSTPFVQDHLCSPVVPVDDKKSFSLFVNPVLWSDLIRGLHLWSFLFVCLFVGYIKTTEWILIKLVGRMGIGQRNGFILI